MYINSFHMQYPVYEYNISMYMYLCGQATEQSSSNGLVVPCTKLETYFWTTLLTW